MKKEILKRIKEVTKQLPPTFEQGRKYFTGEDLIAEYERAMADKEEKVEMEEYFGIKVEKGHVYLRNFNVPVNHFERAKTAYKKGGNDAVIAYASAVRKSVGEEPIKEKSLLDHNKVA